nr:MAG TPA: hypothetical protein [Caudoviricetes sp.]
MIFLKALYTQFLCIFLLFLSFYFLCFFLSSFSLSALSTFFVFPRNVSCY